MNNSPKNILLIQLGDIGDVALSFPCVRALKETYPEAKVIVAVREKAAELIDLCQWADGLITVCDKKMGICQSLERNIRFFLFLRSQKFDVAFDMRTGTRGAIMALLSGAKKRYSFWASAETFWRNRVFTAVIRPPKNPTRHIADTYLELFRPLNITTQNSFPEFSISADRQQEIQKILLKEKVPLDRPLIVIQPFSLWKYKEWEAEKITQLISWLLTKYQVSVLISGGPPERDRAEAIKKDFKENVFNFAALTSIGNYAALLKTSILLISVDSVGPHLAAAVNTPTITIYGPGSPTIWAPRGKNHRVVQKKMDCVPCNQTGCQGSMVSRCLDELSLEEVQVVVDGVLQEIV